MLRDQVIDMYYIECCVILLHHFVPKKEKGYKQYLIYLSFNRPSTQRTTEFRNVMIRIIIRIDRFTGHNLKTVKKSVLSLSTVRKLFVVYLILNALRP